MKEAIGGTWLFNIVIFFILLFAGYMCLSINYSKAFNVKDRIINIIEHNGGIVSVEDSNDPTMQEIAAYLKKVGYRTNGKCKMSSGGFKEEYDYGCKRKGSKFECVKAAANEMYAFCLTEVPASTTYTGAVKKGDKGAKEDEFINVNYYKIKVFYHLDIPVLRSAFNFSIKGDTKLLYDTTIKTKKKKVGDWGDSK